MTSDNPANRPILVGIDGSRSATDAVRWAATEAQRRHTGLRLVEAFGWLPADDGFDAVHFQPSYRETLIRGRSRIASPPRRRSPHRWRRTSRSAPTRWPTTRYRDWSPSPAPPSSSSSGIAAWPASPAC